MKAKASFPSPTVVELKIIAEDDNDNDLLSRACTWLQQFTGCISHTALPRVGEDVVHLTLTLHPLAKQESDFDITMKIESGDRYRIANFVEFFPNFSLYDAVASNEGEDSALILQFARSA